MRSGGTLVHGRLGNLATGGTLEEETQGHFLAGCKVPGEVTDFDFVVQALIYVHLYRVS